MKAIYVEKYGDVRSLQLEDVPDPQPLAGQILVTVRAAGLGFVDALKIAGKYQTKDPLPFVPGMEVAGTVCGVNDAASQFELGDRVFGLVARGALGEHITVQSNELSAIPDGISFVQAAAIPVNYLTALYALKDRAHIVPGDLLLILGAAGGTGTAAIKIGKMLGATVIAAASTEQKRSFAKDAGAGDVIDYTRDTWREDLKALVDGRPIDVVFDPVGGAVSPVAFRTLGWGGRHLVVGFAAGSIPNLAFNIALLKGASLIGIDSAQIRRHEPHTYARLTAEIASLLASKDLEPPPIETYSFERFKDAFESMRSNRAMGKVVLTMRDSGE